MSSPSSPFFKLPIELLLLILTHFPPTHTNIARYVLSLVSRHTYRLLGPTALTRRETVALHQFDLAKANNTVDRVCFKCTRVRRFWHFLREDTDSRYAYYHCIECHPTPLPPGSVQLQALRLETSRVDGQNDEVQRNNDGEDYNGHNSFWSHETRSSPKPKDALWCGTRTVFCTHHAQWELRVWPGGSISHWDFYSCPDRLAPDDFRYTNVYNKPQVPQFNLAEFVELMDLYEQLVWSDAKSWLMVERWPYKLLRMGFNNEWYGMLYELMALMRDLRDEEAAQKVGFWWTFFDKRTALSCLGRRKDITG